MDVYVDQESGEIRLIIVACWILIAQLVFFTGKP